MEEAITERLNTVLLIRYKKQKIFSINNCFNTSILDNNYYNKSYNKW